MPDSFVRVPADDVGKRVDASSLDVGLNTVYRQRMVIADDSATATFAVVTNGALTVTGNINVSATATVAFGTPPTINNVSATVTVAGTIALGAGTANIGTLNNISATVVVSGVVNISATANVVLGAGTANVGTINNVSATVAVAGVVGLTAGTANIGFLDSISRTVQVAVGTPFTVNNVSATVVVAGVVNISATANVSAVIRTSGGTAVEDTTNNALRVNVVAGSAGGPSKVDNETFSLGAGAASLTPIGALRDDVGAISASEGAAAVLRMTEFRALHVSPRLSTGTAMEDTANTALRVNVVAGGGAGGGTSMADRGTFTPGTTAFTPAGGTFNSGAAALSEGEAAVVRLTGTRGMWVNLRDSAGAELGTPASPLSVKVETTSATVQVAVATPFTLNNISATVIVAGVVNLSLTAAVIVGAGTSNIGFINNISATVVVAGVVALTAGTAVIGDVNAISRTVQVAVGTPFTVNNISASVLVATGATFDFNLLASADQVQTLPLFGIGIAANGGAIAAGHAATPLNVNVHAISATAAVVLAAGTANFGTLNNVSATVVVAGNVNISATPSVILAAGTANFGTLNNISATVTTNTFIGGISAGVTIGVNSISATVTVAVVRQYASLSVQSASRGPRMALASTSANVTLVTAPGVGFAIYVTSVAVSNASGSNTRARIGTSASIGTITMMLAASGGGFVMPINPPWKLSTNEALLVSVKPNASEGIFNCNFFVASADAF